MPAKTLHCIQPFYRLLLLLIICSFSSCYSYRISTKAQAGTETTRVKAASLFWGLAQTPKQLVTPNCDSLNLKGMTEVRMRTNFGNILLTVVTLGIYCPMQIEWKCSKPCQQVGHL
jgi:hypothetical protein